MSTKYIESVATTGGTRRRMMSRPLSAPIAEADREHDRDGDGAAEPVRRQPDDEDLAGEVHAAARSRGRSRRRR